MRLEALSESTIQVLFENVEIRVDNRTYKIYPDIEPIGGRRYQHGMRIKITDGNSSDKGRTSSFAINPSTGRINKDLIKYGKDLSHSDEKKHLMVAKAVVGYAIAELMDVYEDPSNINIARLQKRLDDFSRESGPQKKMYIALGGVYDE